MINISDAAAKKISLLSGKHPEADGLRIRVRGGGCSGLQYEFGMDSLEPRDQVFENAGSKVLIDPKSLIYIKGSDLDYTRDLMRESFEVHNPNVKGTCGCGTSFTV